MLRDLGQVSPLLELTLLNEAKLQQQNQLKPLLERSLSASQEQYLGNNYALQGRIPHI